MAKGDSASPVPRSFGNSANMQDRGMRPMGMGRGMYDAGAAPNPQRQENRGAVNPNTQMGMDSPFSQQNPYIGMSRSHAMNTGQSEGYNNFQNMMQPGFASQFFNQMRNGSPGSMPQLPQYGQGGGSMGYMPNQPPPTNLGNDMRANVMPEMQAQLPSYGMGIQGQGGGIQGPGYNPDMQRAQLPGAGRRY